MHLLTQVQAITGQFIQILESDRLGTFSNPLAQLRQPLDRIVKLARQIPQRLEISWFGRIVQFLGYALKLLRIPFLASRGKLRGQVANIVSVDPVARSFEPLGEPLHALVHLPQREQRFQSLDFLELTGDELHLDQAARLPAAQLGCRDLQVLLRQLTILIGTSLFAQLGKLLDEFAETSRLAEPRRIVELLGDDDQCLHPCLPGTGP